MVGGAQEMGHGTLQMSNILKAAKNFGELWSTWLGAGGKPVPKEQSQARANTCMACPMNDRSRPIYEALAGSVAKTIRAQIELKNKMKLRVEGEKSLGICSGCGCALVLKPHVPLEFILKTTDTSKLEKLCWILKEAKGP